MQKYTKIILIVVLSCVLLFLATGIAVTYILPDLFGQFGTNNTSVIAGQGEKLLNKKAPYFDLPNNLSGRVKLSEFVNTPLVVVFWATWNKGSTNQIKIIDDYLSGDNTQKSLVSFLAIDSQEDISVAKSFIKRGGYNVPIGLDAYGSVTENYNIKSLPTAYFIDRGGIIHEIYTGILSEDMFADKIENILK